MAIVEFLVLLGWYATALMECFYSCRLIYIIGTTIWRKIKGHYGCAEDSDGGDEDANCYDEEQGVISDVNGGDGTVSGGRDRCCICLDQICLDQMPDAASGGMWRRLRATFSREQTTRKAGKTCRRLQGCGHVFHTGCIDEWLKQSRTCPSCRTLVEETPGEFFSASTVAYR